LKNNSGINFFVVLKIQLSLSASNNTHTMTDYKRTLITSALPYANGPVRNGQLPGVYGPANS